MTRLADDFTAIRERRDELAREHDGALQQDAPAPGPPEEFLAGNTDAVHALFFCSQDCPPPVSFIAPGIELTRLPGRSWAGTVDGLPIGPYPTLSIALSAARSLRGPYRR